MSRNLLWVTCFLIALANISFLQAEDDQVCTAHECDYCPWNSIILEFRPSYFYPISPDFRRMFHNGGCNYQITGAFPVANQEDVWTRGIAVWGAVDYFSAESHAVDFDNTTKIQIVPLTLGLKYFFPCLGRLAPTNFYVAGGMKYYFIHTHNSSDLVQKNVNVNGMGGVFETGCIATLAKHLVLDLFVSYSFRAFAPPVIDDPSIQSTGMNVGGFNFGIGFGYKF